MMILFVGDIMCHENQLMRMKYGDGYHFDECFQQVIPEFEKYDYVFGNLETVLTDGPFSGFPKFSSPKSFAGDLISAGVNGFLLANNHIMDRGTNGLRSTLDYLDSNEVLHTGADLTDRPRPIVVNNVGILNYTGVLNIKNQDAKINLLDDQKSIKEDIEYLKDKAKSIIMVTHWGNEYETSHSKEQERLARRLIDMGVDVIIGSHPHVIQDYGYVKNHFVAYSMGNFISSQMEGYCRKGIGVALDFNLGELMEVEIVEFDILEENGILYVKKQEVVKA